MSFQDSDDLIEQEEARVADVEAAEPKLELEARDVGGVAGQRLKSFIERIENLEEEKKALAEDIKEVYAELKGVGFDAKTVRKIVSLRKQEPEKRNEEEELLDLYKSAIGMA